MTDPYTRALFGAHAVHVPMWMKVQGQGEAGVSFVGASRATDLQYGSDTTHQLIIGELIVRPHLVIGSNAFCGYGLAALATDCDIDTWVQGDILLDPLDRLRTLKAEGR